MKKLLHITCMGFVGIILLLLIVTFLTPVGAICAIVFEGALVKKDIDNPYVNSGFSNWKTVTVENFANIQIPAQWSLDESDGIITIRGNGKICAQGTVFGVAQERFEDDLALVRWITNEPNLEVVYEPLVGSVEMEGSTVGKFLTTEASSQEYYFIRLECRTEQNDSPILYLVLDHDLTHSEDAYNIAEAIVYSYAYGSFCAEV